MPPSTLFRQNFAAVDLGLSGRIVIVTGGASNLGRAIALGFAKEGARAVIADLDDAQAKAKTDFTAATQPVIEKVRSDKLYITAATNKQKALTTSPTRVTNCPRPVIAENMCT